MRGKDIHHLKWMKATRWGGNPEVTINLKTEVQGLEEWSSSKRGLNFLLDTSADPYRAENAGVMRAWKKQEVCVNRRVWFEKMKKREPQSSTKSSGRLALDLQGRDCRLGKEQ